MNQILAKYSLEKIMRSSLINEKQISILLLILLAAIWGGSFIFIKIALDTITPLTIAAGRILIAAVILIIAARLSGFKLPGYGKAWLFILCAAVFGNVLPFSLISFGERAIDSSLASILMATVPLFNIVIAHLFTMDEKISFEKVLGLSIGFYGIVILIGFDSIALLGNETIHQLMVAGGAMCYAISGVLSRNLKDLPKLPVAAAILSVASLIIVPFSLIVDKPWSLSVNTSGFVSVILLGVLSTALAQLLILKILQLRDSSFLVLNNYMVPMFGVIWGVIILSERPNGQTIIAFAVILLGVFVTQLDISFKGIARRLSLIHN